MSLAAPGALLRHHPVLRVAAWLYPVATIADVLATANHYLLDVITAPGVLVLAYAIAAALALARRLGAPRLLPWPAHRSGVHRLRYPSCLKIGLVNTLDLRPGAGWISGPAVEVRAGGPGARRLFADVVQLGECVVRQGERGGGDVVTQMRDGGGAGDEQDGRRALEQPGPGQGLSYVNI